MNNRTITNVFNSDGSNIVYINTFHCQIMAVITYRILKSESMRKKVIIAIIVIRVNSNTSNNNI